ncbi:MAG: hypothetical protein AB1489_10575 [Acidobacteriota bacterium]
MSKIEDATKTVTNFLRDALDARYLTITKLLQITSNEASWEAEAEVYLPNSTIKTLGLPVQNEILDCKIYLVQLDSNLSVTAYGLRDSIKGEQDE